jgi:hypothetical protein
MGARTRWTPDVANTEDVTIKFEAVVAAAHLFFLGSAFAMA